MSAAGSWVPRRLTSPQSLGRYVVWLYRQVQGHAETAPAKAAKRALTLARILHAPALARAAIQILRDDDLALRAVLASRLELHERLSAIKDSATAPFCARLEDTIERLATIVGVVERNAGHTIGDAAEGRFREMAAVLKSASADASDTLEPLVSRFMDLLEPAVRAGRY